MASKTTIAWFVRLWGLIRSGIKGEYRGKIHCRGPHPLERGFTMPYAGSCHWCNAVTRCALAGRDNSPTQTPRQPRVPAATTADQLAQKGVHLQVLEQQVDHLTDCTHSQAGKYSSKWQEYRYHHTLSHLYTPDNIRVESWSQHHLRHTQTKDRT